MPAPQSGAQARGQHIYLPTRTSDSIKRELVSVNSWTVQQASTGQPTTQVDPSGRIRTTPAEDGVASITIDLNFQGENPDHRYLLDGSVTLEFVQDEIVLETPASTAKVSIAASGKVSFTGAGGAAAGGVGDAIQIAGKDYPIVAVMPSGAGSRDLSPGSVGTDGRSRVNEALSNAANVVYVDFAKVVASSSYRIVRSGTTTGSLVGTCQGPRLAGVPADSAGYRSEQIVFTPTAGIVFQRVPAANRPT